MSDIVKEVIYDLLQFRRAPVESTEVFSRLMHNADLCPKFQYKLELILGAFRKYQQITYDLQGFKDRGSDVAVRQRNGDENNFICLQIKSEADLNDVDYMMKLKAQTFEARGTYNKLIDYYIILCCNMHDGKADKRGKVQLVNKERKNQVRAVAAEFATAEGVHVIEPEYALAFLQLSSIQVDAAIKSKLGAEDIVFREALSLLYELTPTERALVFHLIWLKIYHEKAEVTPEDIFAHPHLRSIYHEVPDHERDWFFIEDSDSSIESSYYKDLERIRGLDVDTRIRLDLEFLEDNFVERNGVGNYAFDFRGIQPLALMMMDGNLRYGYEEEELLSYMLNLFGPMKGYKPQEDTL